MRLWISLIRLIARMSPGGLAGELVGAVAGADGDGECIELGALDEVGRLFRIGQQLLLGHRGVGAVAVFLVALHRLERAEAAQLTLHRDAERMRHVDHLARDLDVVVEVGDRLAVGLERAVHHHRAETEVDRAAAHVRALAVVLVHDERNLRIALERGLDQVLDERLARVFACAGARLEDDRRAHLARGRHHRLDLLEVVDIEGRQPVAVFGGVVEQLAHRNERHGGSSGSKRWEAGRNGKAGHTSHWHHRHCKHLDHAFARAAMFQRRNRAIVNTAAGRIQPGVVAPASGQPARFSRCARPGSPARASTSGCPPRA